MLPVRCSRGMGQEDLPCHVPFRHATSRHFLFINPVSTLLLATSVRPIYTFIFVFSPLSSDSFNFEHRTTSLNFFRYFNFGTFCQLAGIEHVLTSHVCNDLFLVLLNVSSPKCILRIGKETIKRHTDGRAVVLDVTVRSHTTNICSNNMLQPNFMLISVLDIPTYVTYM